MITYLDIFEYADAQDFADELASRFLALKNNANLAVKFRGAWNNATTYDKNSMVKNGGAWWIALQSNLNSMPVEGVDWTAFGGTGGGGVVDGSVTTAKLADLAVTTAKLADGSVTDAKIAAGIDATKIANGNVSNTEFQYLDGVTGAIQGQLNGKLASTTKLNAITAPDASVAMNGQKITNLATPTANGEAATKDYADGLIKLVKIAEVTLGADAANITFSAIPNSYRHLEIKGMLRGAVAAAFSTTRIRFNGDTGANYRYRTLYADSSITQEANNGVAQGYAGYLNGNTLPSGEFSFFDARINNYASTTIRKLMRAETSHTVSTSPMFSDSMTFWNSTAAITSITIFPETGNLLAGSTLTLYGLA